MNSKTLIEAGFCEWIPLKTLNHSHLPVDKAIVVAIVDKELSGKPESDILYIGRTKKPTKRILGGYLAGYGGKNARKISQKLLCEGYMDKAVISWVITEKPRVMQEELLAKYKAAHGTLPAWNNKKQIAKPKQAPKLKAKRNPRSEGQSTSLKSFNHPKKRIKSEAWQAKSRKSGSSKRNYAEHGNTGKVKPSGTETSTPT